MRFHHVPTGKEHQPEELRKASVLYVFFLIFAALISCLGLFYYHLGIHLLSLICSAAALVGVANLLLFRLTSSIRIAGNMAVFTLWATLVLIRWYSGSVAADGILLLSWIWNGVLILSAIFFTGYRWGSLWTCLVFLESGISVYLFRSGYGFENLIPGEISPLYSLGFYLVGLLAILLFAFLFEKEKQEAAFREEGKSRTLRESKKLIEDLLERSPVPTFVVDKKHRVVQWNKACCRISGVDASEIIGRPVWDGFCFEDGESLADKVIESPQNLLEPHNGNLVSRTESGSFAVKAYLPRFRDMPALMKTAPLVGLSGSVNGAIQTIEHVMSSPFTSAPAASALPAFSVDLVGRISGWNSACESLLGYPAPEVLGTNPFNLISKAYCERIKGMLGRALRGESCQGEECECITSEGRRVFVYAGAHPIGCGDEPRGCTIVLTDVTPLRLKAVRAERRAVAYREKLKKTLEEYDLLKKNVASYIRGKQN